MKRDASEPKRDDIMERAAALHPEPLLASAIVARMDASEPNRPEIRKGAGAGSGNGEATPEIAAPHTHTWEPYTDGETDWDECEECGAQRNERKATS